MENSLTNCEEHGNWKMKKKDLIEYLWQIRNKMCRCSCNGFTGIDIDYLDQKIIDLKQGEDIEC